MVKNKRILALSPFSQWPLANGTIVRTWYFVNHLALNNEVWFACRGGDDTIPESAVRRVANTPGRFAQLLHPRFLGRLWLLIRREKIDLIVVIHLWGMIHGLLLKWLAGRPLLFDNHNVEYLRWRRMGSPLWPLVALLELVACHGADQVICVSEADRCLLHTKLRVPEAKLTVLNNGVDVERFYRGHADVEKVRHEFGIEPYEQALLFFGPLSHRANAQAVDVLLDEIVPRLREAQYPWKLIVAGAGAGTYLERRRRSLPENVIFAGFVDNIVALIKGCDLIVVPLTAGSGTRYKILEGVATGRAVISTTVGAEGLDHSVFGEALIIEDDWEQFARAIERQRRQPRQLPVPPSFVEKYDWDNIFARADLHV